jgi:tetratricopeptide (TPR) repeat protein
MTVEASPKSERRFVQAGLPWVVGTAALVAYLVTLNHWVNLSNLALVSRVNGWVWQPQATQLLQGLFTLPLRWLPPGWVPLTLNVLNALCAALTLTTLARSVALLPHDRLEQQRLLVQNKQALLSGPDAWVPIVLAAAALGLQLTFWENAIAASGEMLDLFLFAYVIRCLLEHRIDERQGWLDWATLLFGVGMANNWLLVGFLPLFVVALLRSKRLKFFSFRLLRRIDRSGWESARPALAADLRFFLRMALLGLAGASFFLLLPLAQTFSPASSFSFWPALRTITIADQTNLHGLISWFFRSHREIALLLAASSVLPVLLLSIRWGAFAAGGKNARFDTAAFILYLAHAFLLLLCLWTVFDPLFSPRQIATRNGLSLTFLPLYYLTALSIGYYSGVLLLLFGVAARQQLSRRYAFRRTLSRMVPTIVYLLLPLVIAGLLLVNFPTIRAANAPHLDQYARLAAGSLPPEGGVLLSDDPVRLAVLQAELAREGKAERYVTVDTRALPFANYSAWLSRKYPTRWREPSTKAKQAAGGNTVFQLGGSLDALDIVKLVTRAAQSDRLFCLPPTVGILLERFYLQPHGLIHEMKIYPFELLSEPPLTSATLAENQTFWQSAIEADVKPVLRLASQPELARPAFEQALMKLAHLQTPPPAQARMLAEWYSGALNRWGVTLQRNGQAAEAGPCFTLALDLNAENLAARVNLQCNSNLLAHHKLTVDRAQFAQDQSSKYLEGNQNASRNGPFDEPNYCYRLGLGFADGGMVRQACQQLERVKTLAPGDVSARLALADLLGTGMAPWRALELVDEIRADPELRPLGLRNEVEVELLAAKAWFVLTNRPKAQGILYALLATHPGEAYVSDRALGIFTAYQSYSDALRIVDRQLQIAPNDPVALANKGKLYVLTGDFSNAIPVLTLSLSLTNTYAARLNRALAYLRTARVDAAEADYRELLQAFPAAYRAYYGLGEVAWQRQDTKAAIRYYEQYLSKAEANTEEARSVAARLQSLRQGKR